MRAGETSREPCEAPQLIKCEKLLIFVPRAAHSHDLPSQFIAGRWGSLYRTLRVVS
jgi:hypothetical protein